MSIRSIELSFEVAAMGILSLLEEAVANLVLMQ